MTITTATSINGDKFNGHAYWRVQDQFIADNILSRVATLGRLLWVLEVGAGHGHELGKFAQLGIAQASLADAVELEEELSMLHRSKVVVTGAGGFIGHHLVSYLKGQGYWVRGVDLKFPGFRPTDADEFLLLDLRHWENCLQATQGVDEVYALGA